MEPSFRPTRIVFEKGLEIRNDQPGAWSFLPSGIARASITPEGIAQKYNVHPVLFAEQHPAGHDLINIFSADAKQRSLSFEPGHPVYQKVPFRGLIYCVDATYYHCGRLADLYADTWRTFHTSGMALQTEKDMVSFVQYGIQEYGFYELDALITSVGRCYQTLRFVLSNAFEPGGRHPKNGPRKNFEETLKAYQNMPAALPERLGKSWSNFGKKAEAYRDYILHYFPLDRGLGTATMERMKENVWSVSLLIPDNPESKSPRTFSYDSKCDALTYGWELCNELFEVTQLVAQEVRTVYDGQASVGPGS